jgi:phosphatidylserine decarboxylase
MVPYESEKDYKSMTVRSAIARLTEHEGLNFLLTNRVPRRALTRFIGWFSRIEQPVVRDLSIAG